MTEHADEIRAVDPRFLNRRFGETLAVDDNLAGLDELARLAGRRVQRRTTERAVDRRAAAAPVRLRAVGAEQERPAAGRHRDRRTRPTRPPSPISFRTSRSSAPRRRSWCSWRTAGGCRKSPGCAASRFPTTISISSSTPRSMPASCWRRSSRAADAVGLGTCPISVIRDHSAKVSEMLKLPQRVIPVAGMTRRLAVGGGPHQPAAVAVEHGA